MMSYVNHPGVYMRTIIALAACVFLTACQTIPYQPMSQEEAVARMRFMQMIESNNRHTQMQQQNLWNVVRPLPALPAPVQPLNCTSVVIGNQVQTRCF